MPYPSVGTPQPVPYQGTLQACPVRFQRNPPEGPNSVSILLNWTSDAGPNLSVYINLGSHSRGVNTISQIATIYVDNTQNSHSTYFVFNDSGFRFVAPPFSEGFYPVVTNNLQFTCFNDGNSTSPQDITVLQILNTFVQLGTTVVSSVSGRLAQLVSFETGAFANGANTIPYDNTIPQQTEGDQYMALSITPENSSSILLHQITFIGATGGNNRAITVALFQDNLPDALAVATSFQETSGGTATITFSHSMPAGAIIPKTFKVRAGPDLPVGLAFNGQIGPLPLFNGTMASSMRVSEILQ